MIAHKPAEHDALKEQLRRSLVHLSAQPQAILLRDISLAVAGKQEDGDETISSLRELAIRMAGHSVRLLEFDAVVPVREVFEIASALASEPVHGDEGATFDEKMVSLFLTGVTAHLGTSGFVRQATPGSVRSVEIPTSSGAARPNPCRRLQPRNAACSTTPRPGRGLCGCAARCCRASSICR